MKKVIEKLKEQKKEISTMESCTGGYIVNAITNIEGASEVLKYSAVTYSNEYKIKMGVDKDLIDTYSVYSMEVAKNMSKVICDFSSSDYGVGITGKLNRKDKANLSGSDDVVFISIYDKEKNTYYTKEIQVLYSTREENKEQVLKSVIDLLHKEIL